MKMRLTQDYDSLKAGEEFDRHDPRVSGLWSYLLRAGVGALVSTPDAPRVTKQVTVEQAESLAEEASDKPAPKRKKASDG